MEPRNVNTAPTLLVFLHLCTLISGFLNIEELSSISYAVDILQKPVLSGQSASLSVMFLKSKYGQEYQCTLPEVEFSRDEHEDDLSSPTADIANLLRPLENGPCLTYTQSWWTYEFCYGNLIKQYHIDAIGGNKVVGPEIILGYYESDYDWKNKSQDDSAGNRLQRYHSQYYVNGTRCDVGMGNLRRSEVRFLCEEGASDYIYDVMEPESCRYILTVHTSNVCHHPYLKPARNNKPHPVTCNPVLTADQYEAYLVHEEAVAKEAREQQAKRINKEEEKLKQLKEIKKSQEKEETSAEIEGNAILETSSSDDNAEVIKPSISEGEQISDGRIQEKQTSTEEQEKPFEENDLVGSDELKLMQAKIEKRLNSILKETENDGGRMDEERFDAFEKLASTLNRLLKQLDQAEQDITQTTKTLEKVKQELDESQFPLETEEDPDDGQKAPITKDDQNDAKNLFKVRVSYASKKKEAVRILREKEVDEEQRSTIEAAIRNKLQENGLDTAGIKFKIITAEVTGVDSDDLLNDEESKQFQKFFISLLVSGDQEAAEEMERHEKLEENYRFVWKDQPKKEHIKAEDE